MRYRSTSIERGQFNPLPHPGPGSIKDDFDPQQQQQQQQYRRLVFSLGLSIDCEKNKFLSNFLFSHFALIEFRFHLLYDKVLETLSKIISNAINTREKVDIRYVLCNHFLSFFFFFFFLFFSFLLFFSNLEI